MLAKSKVELLHTVFEPCLIDCNKRFDLSYYAALRPMIDQELVDMICGILKSKEICTASMSCRRRRKNPINAFLIINDKFSLNHLIGPEIDESLGIRIILNL